MKKKNLSGVFALVLLATAGFGVHKSLKNDAGLSDLALANVEALAQNEDEGGNGPCYTFQSLSYDRIVCYGGYTWVWTYEFNCNGSDGSCSGIIGSTGTDCNGRPFDYRTTITRNC